MRTVLTLHMLTLHILAILYLHLAEIRHQMSAKGHGALWEATMTPRGIIAMLMIVKNAARPA